MIDRTAKRVSTNSALTSWWHLAKHVMCRLHSILTPGPWDTCFGNPHPTEEKMQVGGGWLREFCKVIASTWQSKTWTLRSLQPDLFPPWHQRFRTTVPAAKSRLYWEWVGGGRENRASGRSRQGPARVQTAFPRATLVRDEEDTGDPDEDESAGCSFMEPAGYRRFLSLLWNLRALCVSFPGPALAMSPSQLYASYHVLYILSS